MSEITLEKIDMLRERFDITYSEAKRVLELCNGDVLEALVYIEEEKKKNKSYTFLDKDEIIDYIKSLIEKGNATRITIKKNDKVIFDIPLNGALAVGAVSVMYPKLLAVLAATAVISRVTIEITKTDGTVEVINKMVKDVVDDAVDIVNDATSDLRDKINKSFGKDDHIHETNFSYKVKFDD
ncbi:MAG: DUF4342 domain-containing protein [Clostridium argentinense]|uniref:DUF4342 domain-containing protein n=1 Tax=Clostridium butanoliproducens TaxID=2991837 RepID=UPI001D61AA50|nr:DUF4342 domain-containing protein [Clostridium butanoliproducens]MBS5823957.1 DUF4342 domain-containing protein [Clostridium argentinense]MDU1348322.1 DUF4342 domain-containing protein [Clostridium argentinense]